MLVRYPPMASDPRQLLPRDKLDVAGARAVIALGYPAVAPVLGDLLEWLQDCNWPVSRPIADFLPQAIEATHDVSRVSLAAHARAFVTAHRTRPRPKHI